jgi:hypothetical protein
MTYLSCNVLEKDEDSWTDSVRNEEVLRTVKEDKHVLSTVKRRRLTLCHILRSNCLLNHVIEENING